MADAVVVLVDGAVRQAGPAAMVYAEPVDVQVARLFGEVTELPAEADGSSATCALGRVPLRAPARGPVTVLARPGDLDVTAGGEAIVRDTRYLGERTAVTVESGGAAVRADVPADGAPAVGDAVTVTVARPLHSITRV